MREIRFRAWDTNINAMYSMKQLLLRWNTLSVLSCSYFKVMQYTGLKDKNSIKIYEGDILSSINGTFYNTCMGIVREYKGMYVSFYGQDTIGRDQFDVLYTVCDSREVIGNIYENSALLEGRV